ncbi:uncharacterized protein LOC132795363 [Drosophila nasuta]|uniref:uncharacterized protein LOC132795363 n=1 Tax=Drosophila nasuta TaxID=42062 RepID=UPI00295EB538|nr:uncharacterized protein LOC132795363 [Drosophila nasuta]
MNPNWSKSKKRSYEELMKIKKESISMTEPSEIIIISDDESDVAESEEAKVSKRSKTMLELDLSSDDDSVIYLDDVIESSLNEATVEKKKIPLEEIMISLAENTVEATKIPPDETVTRLDDDTAQKSVVSYDESVVFFDVDATEETVLSQEDDTTEELLLPPIPVVVPPKKLKINRLFNMDPEEQERAARSLLAFLDESGYD